MAILSVPNITRVRPEVRVVKAFNPSFAGTHVTDEGSGQEMRDVFLAGDDVEAKRTVGKLFTKGGLSPIDVGPLRRARELEAVGYLHLAMGFFRKPVSSPGGR